MPHYHIRWSSNPTLDWEAFLTSEEAQTQAKQLAKSGESFVIQQVDDDCPRCSSLRHLAGGGTFRSPGRTLIDKTQPPR
jgi:hypothetical protein